MTWTFARVADAAPGARATCKLDRWREHGGLLLWEAFVTGTASLKTHDDDARAALNAFMSRWLTCGPKYHPSLRSTSPSRRRCPLASVWNPMRSGSPLSLLRPPDPAELFRALPPKALGTRHGTGCNEVDPDDGTDPAMPQRGERADDLAVKLAAAEAELVRTSDENTINVANCRVNRGS
jgi:hypothetical protein